MSVTETLFWIIFIGGNISALFNPTYGILLYILVYNLHPESQWWGGHVEALNLRTSLIVAMSTGIGMILNWRSMPRTQSQFPMMFRLMLLFILYCFLVYALGPAPLDSRSLRYIDKLVRIAIFIFMLIRLVRSTVEYRWVLWAWLAGTIYIGYQAWNEVGIEVSGRLSGGLGGPDFASSSGLSAHLVPMMALAGYLFFTSQSKRGQFFALMAAAFAVNTVILTRTRNALPGIVAMVFLSFIRLPKGLRSKCALGIGVSLLLAFHLTDQGWWKRMETLKNPESDPAIARRLDYWDAALEMARQHPFGVGTGRFRGLVAGYVDELDKGRSAHSTYFQCLAELGFPGLFLLSAVMLSAIWHFERARSLGKQWRQCRHSEHACEFRDILIMATASEVALIGFLVSAAFTTRLWAEGFWIIVAMSCCMRNIASEARGRIQFEEKSDLPLSGLVPDVVPG